jgi:hypothetical protein
MEQISFNSSWGLRFSLEIKVGLVVTPSITPRLAASLISLTLAVSIKIFILKFPQDKKLKAKSVKCKIEAKS